MKICEEQILTRKELLDSSLRNMEILGRQEFINWKSLSCNFLQYGRMKNNENGLK